ncbi:MAG: hypothetical protein Q9221_007505 [Calogaya cf. arnoldii]
MLYLQKLADIAASPSGEPANALSSEVLSLHGETRKKRSEIALAVDGYGIEIRDIRSGSIVASYPRSLATPFTFTCPPCSIKLGQASSRDARRNTYCSVNEPGPKLLRFSEKSVRVTGHKVQPDSTSFDLPGPEVPIIHIEAIANPHSNAETPTLDIICVHENGQISCYDEGLTRRRWGPENAFAPDGNRLRKLHVLQVSSTSISKARKTFLKDRDDVLGLLHANTANFAPNLLLLLHRSTPDPDRGEPRKLLFHILAFKSLRTDAPEAGQPSNKQFQEILSFSIPDPMINKKSLQSTFRIHPSNGSLYQAAGQKLFIYNLTGLNPQLVQTINFESQQHMSSYIRISPDLIATLSGNAINVMDTQFASCRAKYDLTMPSTSFPTNAQLLTYHQPSQSAIVLIGRKLLAIDLSKINGSGPLSRKRKRDELLIDAIGHGSFSAKTGPSRSKRIPATSIALGNLTDPYQESTEWKQQKMALNALLEKSDHHEFDRQVSSALGVIDSPNDKTTPLTCALARIVDFALSKMFSTVQSEGTDHGTVQRMRRLHVDFFFGQTWQYLVRNGLVSAERVEASLRRSGRLSPNHSLKDGELIRVLAEQDISLAALLPFLGSHCLVQIPEVCQALKIVIARFATLAAGRAQKLLSNGDEPVSLNDNSMDGMDLANQSSVDSDHLHNLFDVIVARCDACPTSTVTKAFKAQLSTSELQTLVILLRTKLRQDGWLSSHAEEGLDVDAGIRHNDREISMIGKLMNCVIDSLGTRGWLLNNDFAENAAEAVETVSNMQAEVSTALEGIWEANYLRALLGDLLICGKDALKSQTTRIHPSSDWRGTSKTALPLGLKLEQDISLVKVGAGGELQKRSRRDVGKLKSRRVPEYSFEQIAI